MQSTSRNTSNSAPAASACRAPALRACASGSPRGVPGTPITSAQSPSSARSRSASPSPMPTTTWCTDGSSAARCRRRCSWRPATIVITAVRNIKGSDPFRFAGAREARIAWQRGWRRPAVLQRSHPSPPSLDRSLRASRPSVPAGQRGQTTARPAASSARAVVACSSYGRGCGTITAGRRAAATSAIAFWPAWVTTTSAAHSSGHGSATQRRPGGPSTVHVQPGVSRLRGGELVERELRPAPPGQDEHGPTRAASAGAARAVTAARPSKREIAPTAMRLRAPLLAAAQDVGPVRPGRDDRVGEPVAELVREVVAHARQRHRRRSGRPSRAPAR